VGRSAKRKSLVPIQEKKSPKQLGKNDRSSYRTKKKTKFAGEMGGEEREGSGRLETGENVSNGAFPKY